MPGQPAACGPGARQDGRGALSTVTFVLFVLGEGWPCEHGPSLPVSARGSCLLSVLWARGSSLTLVGDKWGHFKQLGHCGASGVTQQALD